MNANALDQFVPLDIKEAREEIFDRVNAVIEQSLLRGPEIALQYGMGLRKVGTIKGYALAHLLWELKRNWDIYATDDDFETGVFKEMGLSTDTTYKYVRLWQDIFENQGIPDSTKRHLLGLPLNTTNLLVSAARRGEIEDWEEVESAVDQRAIRELVKKAKGKMPSDDIGPHYMVERDGRLRGRLGKSPYIELGFIRREALDAAEDDGSKESFQRRELLIGLVERVGAILR